MERPTGVTAIAVLSFIGAGILAMITLTVMVGAAIFANVMSSLPPAVVRLGAMVVVLTASVFAAAYVASGIGLLQLKNWARIFTIVMAILGLLEAIVQAIAGIAHRDPYLAMGELVMAVISIVILRYLFRPEIKRAFGVT